MSYIIVDLDGTLILDGELPNQPLIDHLNEEVMSGEAEIIIVSARKIDRLQETRAWLQENKVAGVEDVFLNDFEGSAFATGFDRETWPLAPLIKGPVPTAPVRFRLRTDAMLARQAAVETGLGVGVYLADVAATRPGLRRILADRFGQVQEVWLCAHDELRRSASMRFVWDRLAQALRARLQG